MKCPDCKIIGVDPEGSILAQPESLNQSDVSFYEVEGIGYDFVPTVLSREYVDKWYKSNDKESLLMSRKLIREEGLLCGGSCGSAMACALKAVKDFGLKKGQRCVVILPDSVRNYMSKFLSDDWMSQRDFLVTKKVDEGDHEWWWKLNVSALNLLAPLTVLSGVTIQDTLDLLNREGFDQVPVVDDSGCILGMATVGNMMAKIVRNKVGPSDPVSKVMYKQFKQVHMNTSLGELSRMLDTDHFVLVVHNQRQFGSEGNMEKKQMIFGIATRIDLLNFITSHDNIQTV